MRVTIIGYGAVGRETANLLLARGDTVRVAQRKRPAGLPGPAEFAATDVLNADSVRRACAGSDAVICCIGFPYDSRLWEKAWPAAMENMLAACASRAGAVYLRGQSLHVRPARPAADRRHAAHGLWAEAQGEGGDHAGMATRARRGQSASRRGPRFRFLRGGGGDFGAFELRREAPPAGQGRAHPLFARPPPRFRLCAGLRARPCDAPGCARRMPMAKPGMCPTRPSRRCAR